MDQWGWYQKTARDVWHVYEGIESLCHRSKLPGQPEDGFSVRPLGPGKVCGRCLRLFMRPSFQWGGARGPR